MYVYTAILLFLKKNNGNIDYKSANHFYLKTKNKMFQELHLISSSPESWD